MPFAVRRPGPVVAGCVLSALLGAARAEEASPPEPLSAGVAWLEFEVTPRDLGTGQFPNGGWDAFDGAKKLFWVGSGWKAGEDRRGRWGLWDAAGNRFAFAEAGAGPGVEPGRTARLVVRADFGAASPGDESLRLWVDPEVPAGAEPRPADAVAALDGLTLPRVDRFVPYAGGGSRYDLPRPRVAARYADLSAEVPADAPADAPTEPAGAPAADPAGEELFVRHVGPLFARKCLACHGADPDDVQGGLSLLSRAGAVRGGESGEPTVLPGDAAGSLLLSAVRWETYEMPPKENDRLTAEEIAHLERWVDAGAPWPDADRQAELRERYESQWETADGVRVATSGGQSEAWTNRRYDPADLWAFRPVGDPAVPWDALPAGAPRRPVDAFLHRKLNEANLTPAPRADARTLARRLHFGLTGLPPTAEQLDAFETASAADPDGAYAALVEELLASPHYGERMARHWLDVTRYADSNGYSRDEFRPDAWRYRDYVVAAFNDDKPYDEFVREQLAADELGVPDERARAALGFLWMGPWEHTNMSVAAETRQLWLDDVTNSVGVTFLAQELRCASCHDHKFDPIPTRDYYGVQAAFASTVHTRGGGKYEVRPQQADAVHVLPGGSLEDPGEAVNPGVLSAMVGLGGMPPADVPDSRSGRRAALADWIASDRHPSTARVMVNRVWQWHFGTGLVKSSNNFGRTGSGPSHPELLDYLANRFVEGGWSVKDLTRLILSSEAYRRGGRSPDPDRLAAADPDGALLSVFPPRRLTAEEVRDAMLATTGELNREVGGPSVRPEIHWEVAFQPRLLMGKLAPPYEPSPRRADRNRRTLYAVHLRGLRDPLLETLNQPGADAACERRDETSVAPQALTLLHGEFSHERSLALAAKIAEQADDPAERVRRAFRAVLGRDATAAEQAAALAFLTEETAEQRALRIEPVPLPTEVTMQNVKEQTGEVVEQTFELRSLKDYEEDLKPWQVGPEVRALGGLCLVLFNSSEFLHVY
ncbi:PSD1 and planctomycete cytochrome C domain-containing protein [Alienimonas sp. DA493]|uniref:PSD1 and planctomycete cytochrome C domain-containing protein n=1 Tax=Alienimonas sp. DA493 TaxID=3373605 RepID=UPI003754D881